MENGCGNSYSAEVVPIRLFKGVEKIYFTPPPIVKFKSL